MSIGFLYKNDEKIFTEKVENGVPYLEYPLLQYDEFKLFKRG